MCVYIYIHIHVAPKFVDWVKTNIISSCMKINANNAQAACIDKVVFGNTSWGEIHNKSDMFNSIYPNLQVFVLWDKVNIKRVSSGQAGEFQISAS